MSGQSLVHESEVGVQHICNTALFVQKCQEEHLDFAPHRLKEVVIGVRKEIEIRLGGL